MVLGPAPAGLPRPPAQTVDLLTRGSKLVPTAAAARVLEAIEAVGAGR